MFGIVDRVNEERGFGFLRSHDRRTEWFFHCSSLVGLDFDETLRGCEVEFDSVAGTKGPKAEHVRPIR